MISHRVVSLAEGKAMAAKIKAPFVETSAVKNAKIGAFTFTDSRLARDYMSLSMALTVCSSLRSLLAYVEEPVNLLLAEIYRSEGGVVPSAAPAAGGGWLSSWFGGGKK